MAMALEVFLVMTIATLLFALAKRKVLVAGRFIARDDKPGWYWFWVAFDVFVVAFVFVLVRDLGGRLWP